MAAICRIMKSVWAIELFQVEVLDSPRQVTYCFNSVSARRSFIIEVDTKKNRRLLRFKLNLFLAQVEEHQASVTPDNQPFVLWMYINTVQRKLIIRKLKGLARLERVGTNNQFTTKGHRSHLLAFMPSKERHIPNRTSVRLYSNQICKFVFSEIYHPFHVNSTELWWRNQPPMYNKPSSSPHTNKLVFMGFKAIQLTGATCSVLKNVNNSLDSATLS